MIYRTLYAKMEPEGHGSSNSVLNYAQILKPKKLGLIILSKSIQNNLKYVYKLKRIVLFLELSFIREPLMYSNYIFRIINRVNISRYEFIFY